MKKIILAMITAILLIGIIGCSKSGSDSNVKEETTANQGKAEEKKAEEQKSENTEASGNFEDIPVTEIMTKKKINYETALTEKMVPLEVEMQKALDSGVTSEMYDGISTLYEAWNKELNNIYELITTDKKVSEDERTKIADEQKQWIEKTEKEIKEEMKEFEGGTNEKLIYTNKELAKAKERALELAKKYDEISK